MASMRTRVSLISLKPSLSGLPSLMPGSSVMQPASTTSRVRNSIRRRPRNSSASGWEVSIVTSSNELCCRSASWTPRAEVLLPRSTANCSLMRMTLRISRNLPVPFKDHPTGRSEGLLEEPSRLATLYNTELHLTSMKVQHW
jgi:hypothetical protein